jgi:hypothetical protein
MRWIVGGKAAHGNAASPSQMGRFETQWLAAPKNLAALADLSGQWIDLVRGRSRPPRQHETLEKGLTWSLSLGIWTHSSHRLTVKA